MLTLNIPTNYSDNYCEKFTAKYVSFDRIVLIGEILSLHDTPELKLTDCPYPISEY